MTEAGRVTGVGAGRRPKLPKDVLRKRALAGDPARILPEHRKVRDDEERVRKLRLKKGQLKPRPYEDLKDGEIRDDVHGRQKVKQRGFSLRSLKGCERHHLSAAEKYEKDWQSAFADTLRGAPWKARVDGGGASIHLAHFARLEVQTRMRDLHTAIGDRDWQILELVLIFGQGPAAIHAAGGPEHKVVSEQIKLSLDKVAAFYGMPQKRKDRMLAAVALLIEKAQRDLMLDRQPSASGRGSAR